MLIYQENMPKIGQFLVLALRANRTIAEDEELKTLYRTLGNNSCRKAAKLNQVEAIVAQALRDTMGSKALSAEWITFHDANKIRVEALTKTLLNILKRLKKSGCKFALVENAGVMFGSDMPLSAFCAGDFDILVDEAHWPKAKRAFEDEGFVAKDRRTVTTNRIEYFNNVNSGLTQWLDITYRAFDRKWAPLNYTDRCALWLSRRVPSRKSAKIYVLNPSDALAFVAIHTSLHSYIRAPGIRLHIDVDRLVRDNDIDWNTFLKEIRVLGMPTRAFVSLSMAVGLMHTPIPRWVLTKLYPGKILWWVIKTLLVRYSVIADGNIKLPYITSLILDCMLNDDGIWGWFVSLIFPSKEWLNVHFAREGAFHGSIWRLHLQRMRMLLSKWRPT